ncbi:MAG: molybdopterin molybdotransferase MoeA [Saprospiraceae bacterium]|nr:molybdopterin molybdotransferase MoeA [Saprospiraceae bacterium]
MIDFSDAIKIVLNTARDFGTETVSLEQSIGRVLRENWYADRDMPPYDRVTMDGIALNSKGASGNDQFSIEGIGPAGEEQKVLSDPANCIEIMTGAILPKGCDTVVRYEDVDIQNGVAKVRTKILPKKNVHWKGEDRKVGELVVPELTKISAAEIGVGATLGKTKVEVSRFPKAIIISTGDELVEIDQQPLPHQIRKSNVYRMKASLEHLGVSCETAHWLDEKEDIEKELKGVLKNFELIILSGGVSKGKFDFLPDALAACGVEKHFHRVAQRPGKPFWFGTHPDGATVFALPGNPISSFMCLHIYVFDWLRKSLGLSVQERPLARLTKSVDFKPDLTLFMEVNTSFDEEGSLLAEPRRGHGSGDLANLVRGDGFMQIPRGKDHFEKGELYPVYFYRD